MDNRIWTAFAAQAEAFQGSLRERDGSARAFTGQGKASDKAGAIADGKQPLRGV